MSTYLYKGYKISNLGYHQPDHCVWWEAVDKNGCACFHGNTLREVEMLINDSEWEDKLKAKDAEIASVMGDIEKLLKNGDLLCRQKVKMEREIEERNALIRELADTLEKTLCDFECEKTGKCTSDLEDTDPVIDCSAFRKRELVAKAREVCHA